MNENLDAGYLRQICAGDGPLRRRIEQLLEASESHTGPFLVWHSQTFGLAVAGPARVQTALD